MTRLSLVWTLAVAILLAACSPVTGISTGIPSAGIATASISTASVATASVATAVPAFVSPLPPNFTPPPTSVPPADTPISTLPGGLAPAELKYRILDQFPDFFYCDKDFYPIAREDEGVLARERFPEIQANRAEFDAILAHNQLSGQSKFTDDQKLLIYRAYKKLVALPLTQTDAAGYQFQIQVAKTEGQGEIITGLIDGQGNITVQERKPSIATCPICLAAGTWIDTPAGSVPIEAIHVGEMVWTRNSAGERVAGPVVAISKTVVPLNFRIAHLVLQDGRELWASPGHPTSDGRRVGQLREQEMLDGASIQLVERVLYTRVATYDLLPSGSTGFYWANGILIASTLK